MKVLVTGAAGFIGYHVARRLAETKRCEVLGIDNLSGYYDVDLKRARLAQLEPLESFRFLQTDFSDREKFAALVRHLKPDYVVHLGAQPGVRYSVTHPEAYVQSNLIGFASVLEACRLQPPKHVVYASSSSVYGAGATSPFREDDNTDQPTSFYGATKKSNELMAHSYARTHGLNITGLRFFTVYGPWGRPDMAPTLFASAIRDGRPLPLFNAGKNLRDFTYVDDIVDGVIRTLLYPHEPAVGGRIFNSGHNRPIETLLFVRMLEQMIGQPAQLELLPPQTGDMPETCADLTRVQAAINYSPKIALEQGLKSFVDWFLATILLPLKPVGDNALHPVRPAPPHSMKLSAAALLALVLPLTAAHAVNSSGQMVIAVIGRSSGTPSTRLVHAGANAAARDLSAKEHLRIQIRWETPAAADPAQEQADLIQKLVLEGVDGIAVSPLDSRKLTAAINDAVEAGIPVACFNADATASKRFYYAGDSDAGTGELMMTELGKLLGGKGTVGVLGGNPATPNLQRRIQGVKTTAAQHYPDVVIRGTYYCQETPAAAAARIAKAVEDSPDLNGWILAGGWAMAAEKAFPWAPGKVQCVSIVSGPAQLHYVRDGYVPVAVMPPYYQWSYQAVSHLVAKLVHHTEPLNAADLAESVVTAANADDAVARMNEQLKDEHIDGSL